MLSIIDYINYNEENMPDHEINLFANQIQIFSALLIKYFNEALEKRLHSYGVTLSGLQYGILRMLQFEPLTISMLSQRMGMDPSSILRIIDVLERKGLVARGVDPNDRRRNPILIRPVGLELLTAVPTVAEQDLTFLAIQSLGKEQAGQLRDLLREVVVQFPEGKIVSQMISGAPGGGFEPPHGLAQ
jgi:DNA-binding MarR family transcriptional regulator